MHLRTPIICAASASSLLLFSCLTCTFTSNTYAPGGNSAWLEANFRRRRRRRRLIGFTYWVNFVSSQWFIASPSHHSLSFSLTLSSSLSLAPFCCGYFLWHVRALRKQTPRMANFMIPVCVGCVCEWCRCHWSSVLTRSTPINMRRFAELMSVLLMHSLSKMLWPWTSFSRCEF